MTDARGCVQAVVEDEEEEEAESAYERPKRTLTKWKIENETPLLEWNWMECNGSNPVKGKKKLGQ